jgi:DNA/RNA-binding domain of Phe-tRNA-synthetase-like protein
MPGVRIDPQLADEGLMVCAIEATPAEPDEAGQAAYDRLFDEVLAQLRQRERDRVSPPTLPALLAFQERYRGRSKPVELPPARLARALLQGKFKRISPVVDVYNLWSAREGLCIGAFDAGRIRGTISVRRTRGDEHFHPIGSPEPKPVEAGGFAYVDEAGEVLCWLDVRQGEATKLTPASQAALLLIEGIPPLTAGQLRLIGERVRDSLRETGAVSTARVC